MYEPHTKYVSVIAFHVYHIYIFIIMVDYQSRLLSIYPPACGCVKVTSMSRITCMVVKDICETFEQMQVLRF